MAQDQYQAMIDFNYGASRFVDEAMYLQFLKRFESKDLQNALKEIQISYNNQNWPDLKRSAHSLKGSSGYVGALTCQKLSEKLQNVCHENPPNKPEVDDSVNNLTLHINDLQKYLSNYFEKPSKPAEKVPVVLSQEDKSSDSKTNPILSVDNRNEETTQKIEEEKTKKDDFKKSKQENHKTDEVQHVIQTKNHKEINAPVYIVKRLIPPSLNILDNDKYIPTNNEEEIDLYDEINKQWRCTMF